MPTDAASAMAFARKNFVYLAEATDETHLAKLKEGATGYIHALVVAGWIGTDERQQLFAELDNAYEARKCALLAGK